MDAQTFADQIAAVMGVLASLVSFALYSTMLLRRKQFLGMLKRLQHKLDERKLANENIIYWVLWCGLGFVSLSLYNLYVQGERLLLLLAVTSVFAQANAKIQKIADRAEFCMFKITVPMVIIPVLIQSYLKYYTSAEYSGTAFRLAFDAT